MQLIPKIGQGVYPGQAVLDSMGFAKSTITNTLKAQGLIILANYAFTCWSLIRQNPAEQEPIRDTCSEPHLDDHEDILVVADSDSTDTDRMVSLHLL